MAHYFFRIEGEGDAYASNDIGMELPSLKEARRAALVLGGALLAGPTRKFWELDQWTIKVMSDEGAILLTVIFHHGSTAALNVIDAPAQHHVLH